MSNFTKDINGWCEYFVVTQPEPGWPCGRGAWGLAGPFACEAEARRARDVIALQATSSVGVMRCAFDTDCGDTFEHLAELQNSARRHVANLRA